MTAPAAPFHAFRSLRTHVFRAALGYSSLLPHEMPLPGDVGTQPCDPPPGAADGSVHVLQPPEGEPRRFSWCAPERAWVPYPTVDPSVNAVRNDLLVFKIPIGLGVGHLGSHGWAYLSADDSDPAASFYGRVMQMRV